MANYHVISAYKHGTTLIKGVQNLGLPPGLQQIISSGSGAVDPTFVSVGQIQPGITFNTTAIKTALANLGGINGAALSSDTFYFQKMAADGKRAGATSHIKVVAANGIIVPTLIRAVQGGEATIGYRAVPRSADGMASPLAITPNQSLEPNQDLVDELYTLGPVEVNGVALPGVYDWTLDFGINLEIITVDGGVYPTFVAIQTRISFFTVRTFDLDLLATWDIDGVLQSDTDSTIQLLDQAEGGVRGSSPIEFSVDAGMAHYEDITETPHGQKIGGSVRVQPVWDGTNDIIAVSGIS